MYKKNAHVTCTIFLIYRNKWHNMINRNPFLIYSFAKTVTTELLCIGLQRWVHLQHHESRITTALSLPSSLIPPQFPFTTWRIVPKIRFISPSSQPCHFPHLCLLIVTDSPDQIGEVLVKHPLQVAFHLAQRHFLALSFFAGFLKGISRQGVVFTDKASS